MSSAIRAPRPRATADGLATSAARVAAASGSARTPHFLHIGTVVRWKVDGEQAIL